MMKLEKTGLISLFFFLSILGVFLLSPSQKAMAGTYDNAYTYYDKYDDTIVFKDGYFYFGTRGKEASASKNTTHWGTIGYRMNVTTDTKSVNIYFKLPGYAVENPDEVIKDGYVYDLYRINLSYVKSKLAAKSSTAATEFSQSGGALEVDSCMITIKFDNDGDATRSGSMTEDGVFSGSVYTSYSGIAGAASWSDPSSLHSYFDKKITYETDLLSKQIVYVRYQLNNGDYGDYNAVINKNYVYGDTVSWSRDEDDCYNEASISYIAKQAKTSYLSVTRKKYSQNVYVKYQHADGIYDTDWTLVDNESVYYGASYDWSYAGSACYNGASVEAYTVKAAKNNYVYISRKSYVQTVNVKYMDLDGNYSGTWILAESKNVYYGATYEWSYTGTDCYNAAAVSRYTVDAGKTNYIYISRRKYSVTVIGATGIASVSGSGSYYYDATCTVDAVVKTGYTWSGWGGSYTSKNKAFTFSVRGNVTITANADANTYYIAFHPNGGSGSMAMMTCKYDQAYTLPTMRFNYPSRPSKYLGWNTEEDSFSASFNEGQKVQNLTPVNGNVIQLFAIWDYAPDLSCKNRYFTLYEAKTGVITETELIRTVKVTDREDGTTTVKVKNYTASKFTGCTTSASLAITYTTTDNRGNITEKQATVTIVDTGDISQGPVDFDGIKSYARFISSKYYAKTYNEGGLENTSKWRTQSSYRAVLDAAMNNRKLSNGDWTNVDQAWVFTKEDVKQVKAYVTSKGMGNSKVSTGLAGFLAKFYGSKQ